MTTTLAATTDAQTSAPHATPSPRFDMYGPIHKALRSFMGDTLLRLGRVDVNDPQDLTPTLAQLDTLLELCLSHIRHEDESVHAAIEARQPGGAAHTLQHHAEHRESIDGLRAEARVLQAAPASQRAALSQRLYQHAALFVAENFQHMHVEETEVNAALWALYSDAEILAIHDRLLASIGPVENLLVARWMVPATTPAERAAIVGAAKAQMPPEPFLGVLAHVRPHLDDSAWNKLARAVGVPQQPGLVHFA